MLETQKIITINHQNQTVDPKNLLNDSEDTMHEKNGDYVSVPTKVNFYCSLIWPFVDAYWVAATVLNEQKPKGRPLTSHFVWCVCVCVIVFTTQNIII
jgi:hypothetical protein